MSSTRPPGPVPFPSQTASRRACVSVRAGGSTCCGCSRSASWRSWSRGGDRQGPARRRRGATLHSAASRDDRAVASRGDDRLPRLGALAALLNLFFLIFIVRAGVQILSDHPRLYWTRHSTPGRDWFRIQRPVPSDPLWTAKQDSISLPAQVGLPGLRHSIGLARWWHLGVDALWLLNGVIFFVLLFATARWERLVPTSWDAFPTRCRC
jgi:hypothetical protein